MTFQWTVDADIVRVVLEGGEWLELKKGLSWGEQEHLRTVGMTKVTLGQSDVAVDWSAFSVARIATWVVDWSARGRDGKPLAITIDNIKALHPKAAQAINEAIDRHIEGMAEEGNSETEMTIEPISEPIST